MYLSVYRCKLFVLLDYNIKLRLSNFEKSIDRAEKLKKHLSQRERESVKGREFNLKYGPLDLAGVRDLNRRLSLFVLALSYNFSLAPCSCAVQRSVVETRQGRDCSVRRGAGKVVCTEVGGNNTCMNKDQDIYRIRMILEFVVAISQHIFLG